MRKYSVQEANNIALGQLGFDQLSAVATTTGNWVAIKAVGGDAVISEILTSVGDDIDTPALGTISQYILEDGDVLYAPITSVTTVTLRGILIAYRR
jgi:hypothetical protein